MSFDSNINDFQSENSFNTTPDSVKETYDLCQQLINVDYLPLIKEVKIIQPYIKNLTSLNLYKLGWRIQFHSSRTDVGLCAGGKHKYGESKVDKNIYISIQYTKHDSDWKKNVRGVILHEIAHAIVFQLFEKNREQLYQLDDLHKVSGGHGIIFKNICEAIQGACGIYYKADNLKQSFKPYKYTCTFCDHVGYGNYRGFTEQCSDCANSVLTEPNLE